MKVIGLTGGIGSGKSTVAQYLAELGAVVIDADKVGHEAYKPGTPAFNDVVAAFGKEVIAENGEVDRKKLGAIVFGSPEALERLNRIMHSRMREIIKEQIEEYRQQRIDVVVIEAAVLLEANWDSLVDEIWVTAASENAVVRRLKDSRGLVEEQTLARIRSQLSSDERVKNADVVINNDGNLEEMKAKVKALWDKLQS
ncbi:dephospho-CoA kinase [Chloroflexota bacterium]